MLLELDAHVASVSREVIDRDTMLRVWSTCEGRPPADVNMLHAAILRSGGGSPGAGRERFRRLPSQRTLQRHAEKVHTAKCKEELSWRPDASLPFAVVFGGNGKQRDSGSITPPTVDRCPRLLQRPTRNTRIQQIRMQASEFSSLAFDLVDQTQQHALTLRMLVILRSLDECRSYWDNDVRHQESAFELLQLNDEEISTLREVTQTALDLIERKHYRGAYDELCRARPALVCQKVRLAPPLLAASDITGLSLAASGITGIIVSECDDDRAFVDRLEHDITENSDDSSRSPQIGSAVPQVCLEKVMEPWRSDDMHGVLSGMTAALRGCQEQTAWTLQQVQCVKNFETIDHISACPEVARFCKDTRRQCARSLNALSNQWRSLAVELASQAEVMDERCDMSLSQSDGKCELNVRRHPCLCTDTKIETTGCRRDLRTPHPSNGGAGALDVAGSPHVHAIDTDLTESFHFDTGRGGTVQSSPSVVASSLAQSWPPIPLQCSFEQPCSKLPPSCSPREREDDLASASTCDEQSPCSEPKGDDIELVDESLRSALDEDAGTNPHELWTPSFLPAEWRSASPPPVQNSFIHFSIPYSDSSRRTHSAPAVLSARSVLPLTKKKRRRKVGKKDPIIADHEPSKLVRDLPVLAESDEMQRDGLHLDEACDVQKKWSCGGLLKRQTPNAIVLGSSGECEYSVKWTDSAEKMESRLSRLMRKFSTPFGEFALVILPTSRPEVQHGRNATFQTSGGHAHVQVKSAATSSMAIDVSIQLGTHGPTHSVHHDFSRSAVCKFPGLLDIRDAVDDEAETFSLIFRFVVNRECKG